MVNHRDTFGVCEKRDPALYDRTRAIYPHVPGFVGTAQPKGHDRLSAIASIAELR